MRSQEHLTTITLTYRCGHTWPYSGPLLKGVGQIELQRRMAYLQRGRCPDCLADAQPYATRRPNRSAWRVS
jgi:hypothetical protein